MGASQNLEPRYSAFLSYSHTDSRLVQRLHRRLESYRLPRRLHPTGPAVAPKGRRLLPVFRDRDELTAAPDLSEAVKAALAESSFLIVVASPQSAASKWVEREIDYFRSLGRADRILVALVRGERQLALHPSLAGAGGDATSPLAADFRRDGDGPNLGLLKLIAPIAGVRLDELVQRDAQRRLRVAGLAAAAAVAGTLVLAGLVVVAVEAERRADVERARGESVLDFANRDLRSTLRKVGRLDLLHQLDQHGERFFTGRTALSAADVLKHAALQQQKGADDIRRGDFSAAQVELGQAFTATAQLLAASSSDPARIYAHAQSAYWIGFLRWRQGDADEAEAQFGRYADLTRRLVQLAPDNLDWRQERAYAASNLGTLFLHRYGDPKRAGPLFEAAQRDHEAVGRLRPTDRTVALDIQDGHGWLAVVALLNGDTARARAERLEQRRLIEHLRAGDPRDEEARELLVFNDLGLGRIDAARGDAAGAMALFAKARTGARAIQHDEPENREIVSEGHAIDLFADAARLSAVPPSRAAAIARGLGDCAFGDGGADRAELQAFCGALRARALAQAGDRAGAQAAAKAVLEQPILRNARLTSRWLVDVRAVAASTG